MSPLTTFLSEFLQVSTWFGHRKEALSVIRVSFWPLMTITSLMPSSRTVFFFRKKKFKRNEMQMTVVAAKCYIEIKLDLLLHHHHPFHPGPGYRPLQTSSILIYPGQFLYCVSSLFISFDVFIHDSPPGSTWPST